MKDNKEKIIEILKKHSFVSKHTGTIITKYDFGDIASDIEELYKDYYPRKFVEWLSYGRHPFATWFDENGDYFTDELTDKRWSLDELYEYWKTIKDK